MPIISGYHSRGRLPHLKVAGAVYFVTFRLADSLPNETVARLKEERDDRLLRAQNGIPEVHGRVRRDLVAWYTSEVDSALDQHVGASWLRDRRVAELVERAIRFFQGDRYVLHAWCVMPNHVHVVVQPLESYALDSILPSWKSFTAHAANKLLARPGRAF